MLADLRGDPNYMFIYTQVYTTVLRKISVIHTLLSYIMFSADHNLIQFSLSCIHDIERLVWDLFIIHIYHFIINQGLDIRVIIIDQV